MPDVLAARHKNLQRANAQTSPEQQGCTHQLQAESFSNFFADLNQRDRIMILTTKGWSGGDPTVWLAEGLLMYLAQNASEQLLTWLKLCEGKFVADATVSRFCKAIQ